MPPAKRKRKRKADSKAKMEGPAQKRRRRSDDRSQLRRSTRKRQAPGEWWKSESFEASAVAGLSDDVKSDDEVLRGIETADGRRDVTDTGALRRKRARKSRQKSQSNHSRGRAKKEKKTTSGSRKSRKKGGKAEAHSEEEDDDATDNDAIANTVNSETDTETTSDKGTATRSRARGGRARGSQQQRAASGSGKSKRKTSTSATKRKRSEESDMSVLQESESTDSKIEDDTDNTENASMKKKTAVKGRAKPKAKLKQVGRGRGRTRAIGTAASARRDSSASSSRQKDSSDISELVENSALTAAHSFEEKLREIANEVKHKKGQRKHNATALISSLESICGQIQELRLENGDDGTDEMQFGGGLGIGRGKVVSVASQLAECCRAIVGEHNALLQELFALYDAVQSGQLTILDARLADDCAMTAKLTALQNCVEEAEFRLSTCEERAKTPDPALRETHRSLKTQIKHYKSKEKSQLKEMEKLRKECEQLEAKMRDERQEFERKKRQVSDERLRREERLKVEHSIARDVLDLKVNSVRRELEQLQKETEERRREEAVETALLVGHLERENQALALELAEAKQKLFEGGIQVQVQSEKNTAAAALSGEPNVESQDTMAMALPFFATPPKKSEERKEESDADNMKSGGELEVAAKTDDSCLLANSAMNSPVYDSVSSVIRAATERRKRRHSEVPLLGFAADKSPLSVSRLKQLEDIRKMESLVQEMLLLKQKLQRNEVDLVRQREAEEKLRAEMCDLRKEHKTELYKVDELYTLLTVFETLTSTRIQVEKIAEESSGGSMSLSAAESHILPTHKRFRCHSVNRSSGLMLEYTLLNDTTEDVVYSLKKHNCRTKKIPDCLAAEKMYFEYAHAPLFTKRILELLFGGSVAPQQSSQTGSTPTE